MARHLRLKRLRRVTSERGEFRRPAHAPDGRLVVERAAPAPELYLLDAKGRIERSLGEGAEPAVSPDGARLAFTRTGQDGLRELWVMDLDGGARTRLAGGDGAAWAEPAWSPDGAHLACVSDTGNAGGLRHVWLVDAAHGERRRVTSDPQRSDAAPAFSPDGTRLAFAGDDKADEARGTDVYVLALDGGATIRLSDGNGDAGRPVFVDDRRVAATLDGGTAALVVFDLDKKRATPVAGGRGGEHDLAVRVGNRGRVHVALARAGVVFVGELRGLRVDHGEGPPAAPAPAEETPA